MIMYDYVCLIMYPPTPAFAKAGAAPGTTAGVELVFLSNRPSLSMAFYGRPSLPFASLKTLQTATTPPSPLPWLLMGFQRRQKLPQGQIHCCFWAVQRAVRQAFAANGHPKATSMASSGLPAASKLAVCQA